MIVRHKKGLRMVSSINRPQHARNADSALAYLARQHYRVFQYSILIVGILSGCNNSTQQSAYTPVPKTTSSDTPQQKDESAAIDAILSSGETMANTIPTTPPTETSAAKEDAAADTETTPTAMIDKTELARRRAELDESVWKNERLAQEYEQAFVRMWDQMLEEERKAEGDPLNVLAALEFDTIRIGTPSQSVGLDWGIETIRYQGPGEELSPDTWRTRIAELRGAGYRLEMSEWHHAEFSPNEDGSAKSAITMALYATHEQNAERVVISGKIHVLWRPQRDANNLPVPAQIDASEVKLMRRVGEVPFREVLTVDHARPETKAGVQPVLVQDLDGDGLAEIALAGSNQLYRNQGNGAFVEEQLCTYPEPIFETGLFADLDRDGRIDFVTAGRLGDLLLYVADENGKFTKPPIGKARGGGPLQQPQVITAGDIDQDGDLDLWVAQYKISYVAGQMPTPYYDANDGFPAFLLINDGRGRFQPMTEEAGLSPKQYRRTYSSSFIDIDDDRDLDLVVISDFAGVDIYENNGKGYFTDITDQTLDNRHLFGMAVTFADYNKDGQLDFFAAGMASTTARRLEFMRLGRRDRPDIHMMRLQMGYGNRMYLGQGKQFVQPEFKEQVARTGWTWGATSLDFDNDADQDIYVANGHSSGKSTKDHCTHFWCHDIYDATSDPNPAIRELTSEVHANYINRTESWDGYQKNTLLMNQQGNGFESIAYLMGIGHQYDGRAVVSDDFDADGRVDLMVVEDRWYDGQIFHLYRNQLTTTNHWIGVRVASDESHRSPLGAKVVVETEQGRQIKPIVSGDSIHAQHATTVHFGLGQESSVRRVTVQWPDGTNRELNAPAIDQYHVVR